MKITDVLNREYEVDCIGCALVDGSVTPIGGIIKETENFILHQDPEVPLKGFLVIATKQHVRSIAQLSKSQALEFFALCYDARKALKSLDNTIECTLIQEERSGHFHAWLFPRQRWMDGLFDNSLSSIRPIMKYAEANLKTEENIREIETCVEQLKSSITT
ncbi:MAG: HIT family hydrolase [Oscillospiraceae bacterium]|nr:HIT family hydrolase [Oscillospiraceae bacterium]